MIARGFKPVVWVGAVGAAALGCYMLSLRVASERADVGTLERRIVATQQQIRSLRTELGTRGRLAQLEQWNDEVLALSAPASGQFIQGAQLASFETHEASPLDGAADIRMASADTTPPAPQAAPAPAQTGLPAPQRAIAPAPPPPQQTATMQRVSLSVTTPPLRTATPAVHPTRPAAHPTLAAAATKHPAVAGHIAPVAPPRTALATRPVRTAMAATTTRTNAAAPPARTRLASADMPSHQTASARRPSLLDARTLREIGSAARAEHRGGTRD